MHSLFSVLVKADYLLLMPPFICVTVVFDRFQFDHAKGYRHQDKWHHNIIVLRVKSCNNDKSK